ncbi:hypothetical protein [Vibrio natriegens]|uniref:hypothetical protein n=1 Tax=Vibrio natriegens TaxID=691 RepID=UPI003F873BBC
MSIAKIIKYVLGALVTVFLGALGSGLWETAVSPFISYIYRLTNTLIASIYSGYYDSVYNAATSEFSYAYMIKISSLILLVCGAVLLSRLFDFQALFSKLFKVDNRLVGSFLKGQATGIAIASLMVGYFMLVRADSIQIVQSYSHMSMEILRPYVGEQEYRLLKSEYYSVTNEADFKEFNSKIVQFSETFQLKLPDKYNKAFKSDS